MTVEFFRLRPDTRSTVRAVLEYCYKVTSVDGLKGYQDGVEKSGCPWLLRNCCNDSVVFSILESFIHIRPLHVSSQCSYGRPVSDSYRPGAYDGTLLAIAMVPLDMFSKTVAMTELFITPTTLAWERKVTFMNEFMSLKISWITERN